MAIPLQQTTVKQVLLDILYAPLQHPEIVPTILPLLLGFIVMELYFGKHVEEKLGWNTSVGNAVIWVATGVTIMITENLSTFESRAAGALVLLGASVTYLDFFHKWPEGVAFMVSSSGIVYSLAYVFVVMVKTSISFTSTNLKAAALFIIALNGLFTLIQFFETPAEPDFGIN